MAKYKLMESGVLDTETFANIPDSMGNRHWVEYQKWLGKGNTPDPADIIDPWIQLRGLRDSRLLQSDWTQLVDAQLSAQQIIDWKTYRQILRDIPQTFAADPNAIVWPLEPA